MNYNRDYYKILGISENSDKKTIKKAYKKLALKYHPDINKSKKAEKKIKLLNEAYSVLSDDEKRKRYDSVRTKLNKSSTSTKKRETSLVKKESRIKRRKKRRAKKRKSNISKYVTLASQLEEDYGLISGLVGLAINKGSKGRNNSPANSSISTLLNSTSHHRKGKRRHRYGKN